MIGRGTSMVMTAVALLVACGERAVPGDGETMMTSVASTTDVDSTGGSTGDAPSCEALRSDADIGPSVEITVRNESAATVWLDSLQAAGPAGSTA